MTFKKWLSKLDTCGLACNIYFTEDGDDAEPIYCGSMRDIPYWLVDYQIATYKDYYTKPIEFRHNIRKNINDAHGTEGYNGFVIILTEQKEN
jgi:hypothetical protein